MKQACSLETVRASHQKLSVAPSTTFSIMRAGQSAKIREIRQALVDAGCLTLREQARVLRLSRSTTWAVLKGGYKGSGLSTALIKRILASPEIPPSARMVLSEYVYEKSRGAYGHSPKRLRDFQKRLGAAPGLFFETVALAHVSHAFEGDKNLTPTKSVRPSARKFSGGSAADQ